MQARDYGPDGGPSSPSGGVTLTLTTGQVDYLRELVFEDLKEWAGAVHEMAWAASETQGRSTEAADAEAMCTNARTGARPVIALLDLLGWEHPEHLAWRLQKQGQGDGES